MTLRVGQRVRHERFGEGDVLMRAGDRADVVWDDFGLGHHVADSLTPIDTPEPGPIARWVETWG